MATEFAYVPSTSDGRTVVAPRLRAVEVLPDPERTATWAWLMRELEPRAQAGADAETQEPAIAGA